MTKEIKVMTLKKYFYREILNSSPIKIVTKIFQNQLKGIKRIYSCKSKTNKLNRKIRNHK